MYVQGMSTSLPGEVQVEMLRTMPGLHRCEVMRLGYAIEYSLALFWEFVLAWKVRFKVGFDVIQACNPPDTIFLLAGIFKALLGTAFVFDHHDINPELYEAKFGRRGFFHRLLTRLERWTFRTATVSIATNETFKRIAIERSFIQPVLPRTAAGIVLAGRNYGRGPPQRRQISNLLQLALLPEHIADIDGCQADHSNHQP